MLHSVYKYVLNDEIIYIGKSDVGPESRFVKHGTQYDNIILAGMKTKEEKEQAISDLNSADIYYRNTYRKALTKDFETELIRRYLPKYNTQEIDAAPLWDGIDFLDDDSKWHPYRINGKYILEEQDAQQVSGKPLPKYMQLPYNGTKRNILKKRISEDITTWIILNAIKRYDLQPGKWYDLSKMTYVSISGYKCMFDFHGKLLPLLEGYKTKGTHKYVQIANSEKLFRHIDEALPYYKDKIDKEIHFLEENYPSDNQDLKTRRYGYVPLNELMDIFKQCCDESGIAI